MCANSGREYTESRGGPAFTKAAEEPLLSFVIRSDRERRVTVLALTES